MLIHPYFIKQRTLFKQTAFFVFMKTTFYLYRLLSSESVTLDVFFTLLGPGV